MADIFDEVSAPKDIFDEVSVEGDIFDSVARPKPQEYNFPLTVGEALLGKPDYRRDTNRVNAAYQGFREGTNMALEGAARGTSGAVKDVATGAAQILEGTRNPIFGTPFGAINREAPGPMFNVDVLAAAKKDTEDKLTLVAENPIVSGIDWYADAVHELRDKIKKDVPVDPEYSRSLEGQVIQGLGQMVSQLPSYVIPGVGPALTVGQLYQEGYDDYVQTQEAKGKKVDPQAAHHAGLANAPSASLEYLGDKLLIGRALGPLKGRIKVKDIAANITASLISEGATEGAQQFWLNIVAKQLNGYDPERELDQDVINSIIVGGLVGSMVTTATSATSLKNLEGGEPEVDSTPPTAPTEDGGSTPPASINPDVREELDFVENPPVKSVSPIAENIETEEQVGVTTVDPGVEQLEIRDIIDQVGLPEGVEGDTIIPDVTPQQDGAPVIENTIAMNRAEIDGLRYLYDMAKIPDTERITNETTAQNAKAKGLDITAEITAEQVLRNPVPLNSEQFTGMQIRIIQLEQQARELAAESEAAYERGDVKRGDEVEKSLRGVEEKIDNLTHATLLSRSEVGRALGQARMRMNRDNFTLAKVRQRAALANKGKLSADQSKHLEKLTRDVDESTKKIQRLGEEIDALREKALKEDASNFFQVRRMRRRQANTAERRAAYKQKLKELGVRVNDITNLAGLSAEAASLVSKIAETYIDDGVANLTDLVNKMKQDLPELSDNDIYNSLGNRIARKKTQIENRIKTQMKELKKQAALWGEVHDLLNGKVGNKRILNKSSAEVRALRDIVSKLRTQSNRTVLEDAQLKRVNEAFNKIQDQLEGKFRYIPEVKEKKPTPSPALTQAKETLKEARQIMRGEDILADLDEQIRTDELAIPRQQPQIANARLRKIKEMISEKRKIIQKRRRELENTEQAQVDRLLKKLELLEQQIEGGYRFLKKSGKSVEHNTVEVQGLRDAIREAERLMRTKDANEDLLEQLRTGVPKLNATETRTIKSAELQEELIHNRALKKLINHQIERIRKSKLKWYSLENVTEALHLSRAIQATADHSAILRQGMVISSSRPIVVAKAIAAAEKAFWSSHSAYQIDIAIRNHPNQIHRDAAGLEFSELDGVLSEREEFFSSNLVEKIPGLGNVARASNRHMVTYLNLIRAAAFDEFLAKFPDATLQQKKLYAKYVNLATGKGSLKQTGQTAKILNFVFFAPRFAVSRFQVLITPFNPKYFKDPVLRKAIAKDYMSFVGIGLTTLALASLAGFAVGADWDDSDFGKIIIGDTRVDIWGGLLQPARLIAMTMMSFFDGPDGIIQTDEDISPVDAATRFAQFKLSPAITVPNMIASKRDAVGNRVTLFPEEANLESVVNSVAFRATTPLILQETLQVMAEEEDPGIVALSAGGTFWGLGVNTYEKKKK